LAWCATQGGERDSERARNVPADAGASGRSTAWVEEELEIPELEPDAGPPPDAGTVAAETHTKHSPTTRSWDSCTGDISPADARRVIEEFNAQIRACYERQLKQNPMLEGNMMLAVRVASNGEVDGVQVSGSLRDREVFACVRQIASRMRFPPPGGRDCAVVQVPYQFTPRR
jgi:TonB family protein